MDDLQIRSSEAPASRSLQAPKDSACRTDDESTEANGRTHLSFRVVKPATIIVQSLNVRITLVPGPLESAKALFRKGSDTSTQHKSRRKTILDAINARMPSGSLTAIMGASGSGKTSHHPRLYLLISIGLLNSRTFLDAISNRIGDSQFDTSGGIWYNGVTKLSNIRSAYVEQKDVLLPMLTVRETLQHAADLRLAGSCNTAERKKIVEEVILELGLKECASTRIGDDTRKGCSGGEKRRTSLAIQMLANPTALFLDEVTTGLDATSAFQLVRTLKYLARNGRTIIMTIHQPRSEIWGLFDRLVLLSEGHLIYSGPASTSIPYFERLGNELPQFVNPAEFLVDLVAIDTRRPELEVASRTRVQHLRDAWLASSLLRDLGPPKDYDEKLTTVTEVAPEDQSQPLRPSFANEVLVQTARTFKTTIRDPLGVLGSLTEATILGIIAGWIFIKLDGSLSGIRSREGALYTAAALQGYLILLFETYRLTLDIAVFDRERNEHVVGVLGFLISRRLARLPLEDIIVPLVFSTTFYFLVGFRLLASQFFGFFAIVLLCQYVSVTLAMVCVAFFRDFARASLIANLSFTFQSICSE